MGLRAVMCPVDRGKGVSRWCRLGLVVAVGAGSVPLGVAHREEKAIWCVCWVKAIQCKEAVLIAACLACISFER